jgi:hypothetical protein
MTVTENRLKELASLLKKGNNEALVPAIELLREEQPFEGAIGLLTSFYDKTEELPVRKAIEVFMNDLKNPSAAPEVINEIRKQWNPDTISMLVSSCWQSGLDYSLYAADLAEVFLKGDYITAIECLTVIEETSNNLTREKKDEIIGIINEKPGFHANEKRELTMELLSILKK